MWRAQSSVWTARRGSRRAASIATVVLTFVLGLILSQSIPHLFEGIIKGAWGLPGAAAASRLPLGVAATSSQLHARALAQSLAAPLKTAEATQSATHAASLTAPQPTPAAEFIFTPTATISATNAALASKGSTAPGASASAPQTPTPKTGGTSAPDVTPATLLASPGAAAATAPGPMAAPALAALSPETAAAVQSAIAVSEVNPEDVDEATATLARSMAPWPAPARVLAPVDQAVLVPVWASPISSGTPTTLTAAETNAMQHVPPAPDAAANSSSTTWCCRALTAMGFRSNLGVVVVDTGGGGVVPLRVKGATARVCTCGAPGGDDWATGAEVRVRGSSSAVQMVKKQLSVQLRKLVNRDSGDGSGNSEDQADQVLADGERGIVRGLLQAQASSVSSSSGNKSNSGVVYEVGNEDDRSLMGMPPSPDWVLWGDDLDHNLGAKNSLGYDAERAMGLWAPRSVPVEMFIVQDGTPLGPHHYWGVYLAMEKIERDKKRVKIQQLHEDKDADLTGGYIMGYERTLWPRDTRIGPRFVGAVGDGRGLTYTLHYPGVQAQANGTAVTGNATRVVAWPSSYLAFVESALVNDTLPDTANNSTLLAVAGRGSWRALVDEAAFIDYMLILELTKNPDAFRGSVYMSKDRGGKLVMGPVWDLNEAWGECCGYPITGYREGGKSNGTSGGSAISPEGWRFNICDEPQRCVADPIDGISLWWREVWSRDPSFRAAVAARWQQLRTSSPSSAANTTIKRMDGAAVAAGAGAWSDAFFQGWIANRTNALAFAAPRDFARWELVKGPEAADFTSPYLFYAHHWKRLANWLTARLAWLDHAFTTVASEAAAEMAFTQPPAALTPAEEAQVMAVAEAAAAAAVATAMQLQGVVGINVTPRRWAAATSREVPFWEDEEGGAMAAGDVASRGASGGGKVAPAASVAGLPKGRPLSGIEALRAASVGNGN